uniref:Uncharacterized protein n=1 Tax=Anguilla anguilla TaxID=7936 RepID=A0A0E9QFQ3_ANGAN
MAFQVCNYLGQSTGKLSQHRYAKQVSSYACHLYPRPDAIQSGRYKCDYPQSLLSKAR